LLNQKNLAGFGIAVGVVGILTSDVVADRVRGWFGKNKQQEEDNMIEEIGQRRTANTLNRLGIDDYYYDPHSRRWNFDLEASPVTLSTITGSRGKGNYRNPLGLARSIEPQSVKGTSQRLMLTNIARSRTYKSTRNASNQHVFLRQIR
jgi:hypothetical protein